MEEIKVWYDIDGVLAEFEQHFLRYLKLPRQHATSWEDSRFRDNMHRVAYDDAFWLGISPIFNPKKITYPVAGYCTARSCNTPTVRQWLDTYGFPEAMIINVGLDGDKGEALKGICDIMIDDGYHNFLSVAKQGIDCYLMSRPHNLHFDVGDKRVDNIDEFMKIIENEYSLL